MLCSHPWMRAPLGVGAATRILSENARMAAMPLPCGQCLHCRINKARVWVRRIMLEAMMHEESCIVALTYDDDHVPVDGSLVPMDMTGFLKRLRFNLSPRKIRYYYVGEYGEEKGRPHYHAALFNVFMSEGDIIAKSWGFGNIHVGELTQEYARYIAGYVVKGLTQGGDVGERHPEFMRCSRRPGIGGSAADLIAKKWSAAFGGSPPPMERLKFGRSTYPVGRYLKDRIGKASGVDASVVAERLREYQDKCFELGSSEEVYYDGILSEKRVKRSHIEHNFKVFKRRRVL